MRAVAGVALVMLVGSPAFAGDRHDRMQLPPAAPAFALSDGDPYGQLKDSYGPPAQGDSDLTRFARSIGFSHANGHSDVFQYSLSRDDNGNAEPGSAMAAGTLSDGAAEFQLRWNTN